MGLFKKISKQLRKAVRSPSHSRLSSVATFGAIGKHNGRIVRQLGISRKKIMSALGLRAPVSGYNSAAAYQPRRISSLMGGVS